MNKTLNLNRAVVTFGIPAALLGVLILLMKSPFFTGSGKLDLAITIDLLILTPLVYFLLIRKTSVPKTTVVPLMILGLLIGTYFLPKENQLYINMFRTWALPVIEVSIFTYVIIKVRAVLKKYKQVKGSTPDFFGALKKVCAEILPSKLVMPFATEVAVLYYGFFNWKKREVRDGEFTYHKRSGTSALMGAFVLIIGVETVALHVLLSKWNLVVAWILTILSVYTAIQVIGFARSLSQRPISVDQGILRLKYGILNEAEIPLSDVDSIELSRKSLKKDALTRTLSPLGEIESHNVIIHLKKENELIGLYGVKRKFKVLALHVDEPKEFEGRVKV